MGEMFAGSGKFRVAPVWFGSVTVRSVVERLKRFRFSVPAVPLGKGSFPVFQRRSTERVGSSSGFRFLKSGSGCSAAALSGLVAGDSAICGRLAALILRLRPAGLRFEEFRSPVKRGGLGLRFSNRSGLRPAAI